MKRNARDKRKSKLERREKKRLARERDRKGSPLRLADNSYVDAMRNPAALKLLMTRELLTDSRVNIWLLQLNERLDEITHAGGVFARSQAEDILRMVNEWENTNAGKLRSRVEASVSIARMLDQVIAKFPPPSAASPQAVRAHAETIGEIVNAIQIAKSNFVMSAERVMLPEGQAAVSSYLYCVQQLLVGAQGIVENLEDQSRLTGIEAARLIWSQAKEARVFEIQHTVWESLHHLHDQHFGVVAADKKISEGAEALAFIRETARNQPFPEKLPFDFTYIGLGAGVLLDSKRARLRFSGLEHENVLRANLLGYLICGPDQQVYEMLHVITTATDYFLPLVQRNNGRWLFGETLAAWLAPQLVDLINEHNTVVLNHEPTPQMRANYNKAGKGVRGFIPKPYYTVRLKHKIIDEAEENKRTSETGLGRILGHRYDRRGHERCYVHRGPFPIDEKTEQKLLRYEYRFILGKPDAEDAARLGSRALPPKRSDEWMAIKVRWIEDMVVGDEKLPYVPAVRVPENREDHHAK